MDDTLKDNLCAQQYIDYTPYKLRDWIERINLI